MKYIRTLLALFLMGTSLVGMDKSPIANACMVYFTPSAADVQTSLMNSGIMAAHMAMQHPKICSIVDSTTRFASKAAFIAPALIAYNSESIKNSIMRELPNINPVFDVSLDRGIKNTLKYGGIALAGYLFYTQTLEYLSKNKLEKAFQGLNTQSKAVKRRAEQNYKGTMAIKKALDGLVAQNQVVKNNLTNWIQEAKAKHKVIGSKAKELKAVQQTNEQQITQLKDILSQVKIPELTAAVSEIETISRSQQENIRANIGQIDAQYDAHKQHIAELIKQAAQKHQTRSNTYKIVIDGLSEDVDAFFEKVLTLANGIYNTRDQIESVLKLAGQMNDKLDQLDQMSESDYSHGSDESEAEDEDFPRGNGSSGRK